MSAGDEAREAALAAIRVRAEAGNPLRLWLRDDDAVRPHASLDRLLDLTAENEVPLTLAVIPAPWGEAPTGAPLATRLDAAPHVRVAVHGWSHHNHALPPAKKQELGGPRPDAVIHAELREGLAQLRRLHGARALPLLVPPWNRISPSLTPGLAADGFTALSVYGPEQTLPEGLRAINTQIDIMNWKAGSIGRPAADLWAEMAALAPARSFIGVLTHHLVHDATAWAALSEMIRDTRSAGAEWVSVTGLGRTSGAA